MSKVHIELQRVQTWLFSVPRLRAMVGANTLLGEVLRVELPRLARQTGTWSLTPASGSYPGVDPDDPLQDHDDPAADAAAGILARDGGHFEAVFSNGAEAFAEAAAVLLHQKIPGLRFRIRVDGTERLDQAASALATELPVFSPCEWTGRGLASTTVEQGDEPATVSLDVSYRHQVAKRAEDGKALDLASLLIARTQLKDLPRPLTFEELVGNGYLALIHADGNGVGGGAGANDVARAGFFHRNRVLLRRALKAALDQSCANADAAPLEPLMLGGDDLLVVSRASAAMPFVSALCQELQRLQAAEDGFRLTMGVGVVFAKRTVPIHRLHEAAECLAASAKRRVRGIPPQERRSVVDWAVYTTAWVDDPEEVRRRDWVRGSGADVRVLSRRPMDVLGEGLDSLQGLVRAAAKLDGAPRSQLHYLVDQLPRGKTLAELAFEELSSQTRNKLEEAGISAVWIPAQGGGGPLVTSVMDVVDVLEIKRLGRAGSPPETGNIEDHKDKDATDGEVLHVQA